MSVSTSVQSTPCTTEFEWRKRSRDSSDDYMSETKRARYNYPYYTLAPEDSDQSDDGTESVCSLQEKETDYAKDTTDTDTKSELSDDCDLQVEYDVATESEEEQVFSEDSSSDSTMLVAASAVVSTIVDETTKDKWAADEEDESDSGASDLKTTTYSQTCRMCKIRVTTNGFVFCSHCHQIRKTYFTPRPRKKKSQASSSSSLSQLSSLTGALSQDSGIHSLDSASTSSLPSCQSVDEKSISSESWDEWALAIKGLCIMCNEKPKNGIFLHTYGGHMCCCYRCAVKYWNKSKRCAYCNQKVKNVLRAFIV